jgi:hypothetical protein
MLGDLVIDSPLPREPLVVPGHAPISVALGLGLVTLGRVTADGP